MCTSDRESVEEAKKNKIILNVLSGSRRRRKWRGKSKEIKRKQNEQRRSNKKKIKYCATTTKYMAFFAPTTTPTITITPTAITTTLATLNTQQNSSNKPKEIHTLSYKYTRTLTNIYTHNHQVIAANEQTWWWACSTLCLKKNK